jgi:hypothetical protein
MHMLTETRHVRTAVAILVFAACLLPSGPAALGQQSRKDYKGLDLADFLGLGEHYVKPVDPKKDAKTGFVVGGKNATAVIRKLDQINGRTIAELERDMRPGAKSEVGSNAGFLGPKEKLLDVLAADNRYVVDELGLTHQELAKHLHAMGTIGLWKQTREVKFTYLGRRFTVKAGPTSGTQPSPFRDGTNSGNRVTVHNLDNGKKLEYALLVPYMIERYGFYEGKGTPYRVEPRQVAAVFDFLKARAKKK